MSEMLDIALASQYRAHMPGPNDSDVSQFWLTKYGIANFAAFKEIVGGVLASPLPFGNLGFNTLYAATAWSTPTAPAGLAVQLYLRRAGYSGTQGTAYQDAVDLATQQSVQNQQELSMTTLIIPGAFQVTISALVDGHVVDNVIGVVNPTGNAGDAAQSVKDAWEDAGGPMQNLPAAYVVQTYTAVDLSSATGTIAVVPSTTAGGDTGNPIATRGAAALIRWNGGSRSRSTRGRMYLGPLTTDQIASDGATIPNTQHTTLNGNISQFLGELAASGYPLQVLSRKLSIATPVATHLVETEIATQRRRIRN